MVQQNFLHIYIICNLWAPEKNIKGGGWNAVFSFGQENGIYNTKAFLCFEMEEAFSVMTFQYFLHLAGYKHYHFPTV